MSASEDGAKEELAANTQEALDLGAFGVPTFAVKPAAGEKGRIFFGQVSVWMLALRPHGSCMLRVCVSCLEATSAVRTVAAAVSPVVEITNFASIGATGLI